MDAFDLIKIDSPEVKPKFQKNNGKGDAFDYVEDEGESFWKNAARTALQIPQGLLEGTNIGLKAMQWHLLGMGEIFDPEEIERIKDISEREGIPFDEQGYEEAGHRALGTIPTLGNIASKIEEKIGLPLEPKNWYQKALRLGSLVGKAQPGAASQKVAAGVAAPATSQALQSAGVPEPFADLAGLGVGGVAGEAVPKADFTKSKPSGLPERYFENIKEKTEVSPRKLTQINDKLENDFKSISDKIIKESPVGETAENLRNDPTFKQQSRELLNQAQEIANSMPDPLFTSALKKEYADVSSQKIKGFSLSEFDKNYMKFMKEAIEEIIPEKTTFGELVEQYRKNNSSLSEYFEPGSSKALNRAKKQALLDQNRSIANIIEKSSPELSEVFKDGNARWTKIMDAEAVDGFINEIFKEGVNYKKMRDFFDKNGYDFTFKRALGEQGFKDFEQLMKDVLTSEKPYKMMRVAQARGMEDLVKTGMGYVLHPKIGYAKATWDAARGTYKTLINAMLDKPKIGFTWKRAIDELKKGDFAAAEKDFATLDREIKEVTPEVLPKESVKNESTKSKGETIQAKTEKIQPEAKKLDYKQPKESNPISEPKLIEYKPSKKPTVKEQTQAIARDSFSDAVQGQKLSEPEKSILKNTEVAFLQTRGKGQQYHGTRQPIKKLSEDIYSSSGEQNIYGPGFYTTDALDIADGYSKAKFSKEPKVYQVIEKTPQKIYDAEQPIGEYRKFWLEKEKQHFESMKEKYKENKDKYFDKYKESFENYLNQSDYIPSEILLNEEPTSLRDFYDKIRERSIDEGLKAYEVQEYFDSIQSILESHGYEGISHKGGLLTNNPEHHVKIYWMPENLEIQEFYYPKEFKKVSKTAKPPELPATPKKAKAAPVEKEVKPKKLTKEEESHLFGKNKKTTSKKEKSEPAKSLTEKKVEEVKHQDISKKGLKEQKNWLRENLEEAIANAPDPKEIQPPSARKGTKAFQDQVKEYRDKMKKVNEYLTFDVPGDGEFRIKNHKKALEQFRDSVEKRWPDKPLKELYPKNKTNPAKKK